MDGQTLVATDWFTLNGSWFPFRHLHNHTHSLLIQLLRNFANHLNVGYLTAFFNNKTHNDSA